MEDSVPIENELLELEKKLKAEILSGSEKQIMCGQLERLLERLDEIFPECLRILKTEACHYGFTNFSNAMSHYQVQAQQGLWKQNIVSVNYSDW